MSRTGPILILEDDHEDQELFRDAFREIGVLNPLVFFHDGVSALEYLQNSEQPFIIFSDINLPLMDGFQFRKKISENYEMMKKSIPFIFFTTSSEKAGVEKAYEMTVQGYFTKGNNFEELKQILQIITSYWSYCKNPNSV